MTQKKLKTDPYADFMNMILAVYMKITKRCMLEGCRYGYFPTDKPTDNCIYCDQPRVIFNDFFKVVNLRKELKKRSLSTKEEL